MPHTVIEAENLKKHFTVDCPLYEQVLAPFAARKVIHALRGIDLCIKPGEILGIVGPNGAGKTTLLRIFAGLLEADSGHLRLCGKDFNGGCRLRAHIGYVSSDDRSFFWRLTGIQNLEFFAGLYGIRRQVARKRIAKLLPLFSLEKKATELFRDYSTGTRKKFALVRALIHKPRILLLDEVTNSLDAPSAQKVKSLVREYVSTEICSAAVWSTHRFEEIGEVCDRVLAINKGSVKFSCPVGDLKDKYDVKACHTTDIPLSEEYEKSHVSRIFCGEKAKSTEPRNL
jgi:ABC-2 type transport system ATP-binding protein